MDEADEDVTQLLQDVRMNLTHLVELQTTLAVLTSRLPEPAHAAFSEFLVATRLCLDELLAEFRTVAAKVTGDVTP